MNKISRQIIFAIFFILSCQVSAQDALSALIPMPKQVEIRENEKPFDLKKRINIEHNIHDGNFLVQELKRIVKEQTGIEITEQKSKNVIRIIENKNITNSEAYNIDINSKEIRIEASSKAGIFYALQTIEQILLGDTRNTMSGKIASLRIHDEPRYKFRAVMLDPARHFLPIEDIKLFIDRITKYKYNKLQLHLTDDQGWRIEIKSHPELTAKGAYRNPNAPDNTPDNGYYTQEQLKELIQYAALRNVEIIPELDIPGHSVAILTAYPHLGCSFRHNEEKQLGSTTNMMLCAANNQVYDIYADIIKEVAAIFPSQHIHLGGDEAAVKDNWAKCKECTALMEANGYNNHSQLMNIFFGQILDIVRQNNKKAILWCELDNIWPPANEYLFPYPHDVTLVTWRNALTPKCIELTHKHRHSLIMAPGEHCYLDYPQWKGDLPEYNNWGMPITSLEKTYELDPGYNLPDEEQAHIQGVMATLWAEAIKDINRVCYMFFPRGLAIAEAAWSDMQQRSWQSFKQRLYPNLYNMMKNGISFRVPFEIAE